MSRVRARSVVVAAMSLALAGTLVAGNAGAQKRPRKPGKGAVLDALLGETEPARATSRMASFAVGDLPRVDLPKMPKDDGQDKAYLRTMPSGQDDPATISIREAGGGSGADLKKWRMQVRAGKSPSQPGSTLMVRLDGVGAFVTTSSEALPQNWYYAQYGQMPGTQMYCTDTAPQYRRVVPVRSERLSLTVNGDLEIEIADHLFDAHNCELTLEKTTKVSAKALAKVSGKPVLWGMKSGNDELTLLFPWTSSVSVDTSATSAQLGVGAMYQLRVPTRGAASSVALTLTDEQMTRSWRNETGGRVSLPLKALTDVTFGIDIVQAVSDPSPSITVRVTGEPDQAPVEPPDAPIPQPGKSAYPSRSFDPRYLE